MRPQINYEHRRTQQLLYRCKITKICHVNLRLEDVYLVFGLAICCVVATAGSDLVPCHVLNRVNLKLSRIFALI